MYFDQVHYLLKLKWVFVCVLLLKFLKKRKYFFLSKNIVKEFARK